MFTAEELSSALTSALDKSGENSESRNKSLIRKIKEWIHSNNDNNNNNNNEEKFLTLEGVPNKDSFALQVSLLRYSGFNE